MTTIFPGFGATRAAISELADCQNIEEVSFAPSKTTVGGLGVVGAVKVTWPAFTCFMDKEYHTVAAGSIYLNSDAVATPTTYYVYFTLVNGIPTAVSSTTDPAINPAVDEHFTTNIIRFYTSGATAIMVSSFSPAKRGLYELAHTLREDAMFTAPTWLSGMDVSYSTGGKISTTNGYVRFIGNHADLEAAVTEGAIVLDDEVTTITGLNSLTTYSDGSTITAGKYVKLLLGWKKGSPTQLNGKFILIRQGNPGIPDGEYTSVALAHADAEQVAATGFGSAYRFTVLPLAYIVMLKGDYTDGAQYDLRVSGINAPGGGGAPVGDHSLLTNLNVVGDHQLYLDLAGNRSLTGNWDAGSFKITAETLASDVATGTAPLTVASTTKVTNLNADQVDGKDAADFLLLAGGTMSGALNMGSKSITAADDVGCATVTASGNAKALTLQSTQTTGTAPLTVASTTVVSNLNADKVDGKDAADFLLLAGGTMSGALNMGSKSITAADDVGCATVTASGNAKALTLQSTQTTGTAPLTVASTTKVTNLNADQVDGKDAADFLLLAGGTMTGALNMGSKSITAADDVGCATVTATGNAKALTLQSTQTTGTAPLTVASTTVVTNLNADTVDGYNGADFLQLAGGTMTGALNMGSKSITAADDVGCATVTATGNSKALTLQSTQTTGTAPLTVASTTVVTNLNADKVDGYDGTEFLLLAGGTMSGALNMGSKSISAANDVGTTTLTASGNAKALTLQSTQTTGTAPLTVASTTVVTNLNADKLDGLDDTAFLKAAGTVELTGNMSVASGITIDGVDISAHAADANAHHNAVTLGANTSGILSLSTQAISMATTPTTSQVLAGPAIGASSPAAPAFRQLNIGDINRPSMILTLTGSSPYNDVALTTGYRVYVISTQSGNFTITGFTGGVDGAVLYLHNNSGKTMTLSNQTGSTSSNQIKNTQGTTVANGRSATLTYITADSINKWVVTSIY